MVSNSRPIRLGFVGGGTHSFIGNVHRAAAAASGRFTIAAGCFSADKARSRESAQAIGIAADRTYENFKEMAEAERHRSDGIEVVAILAPNGMHYDIAGAFLRAGVHIICEKPVTTTVEHAHDLTRALRSSDRIFAVAHAYIGYSTVHEARERVKSGALGKIRVIQIEYAQSWLSTDLENAGHKIARQRTDPDLNGVAGCVAAIGTHAYNLADFVTGLELQEVSADLTAFVAGRRVPDNAHILLRYVGGAHGMMWISQVAPGHDNGLRLRIYGERGSLFWSQEQPESLVLNILGEPGQILARGGPGAAAHGLIPLVLPPGHPEGFVTAFTNFYAGVAEQIAAKTEGRKPDESSRWIPTLQDGVRAVEFAHAATQSSSRNGSWISVKPLF